MKNRLKVLRAENDLSQAELANRLGVSRQTVNALETGKYDPSLPLAFKIAKLFALQIEEIFFPRRVGGKLELELIGQNFGAASPAAPFLLRYFRILNPFKRAGVASVSRAAAKSAIKSSGCSNPTDTRNRSTGVCDSSPSATARCSIKLSTPPKLVAWANKLVESRYHRRLFDAAIDLKREHAAKAAHLPAGNFVPRV